MERLNKALSQKSVIVFDDIQDDTFFRDLTKTIEQNYFLVFKFEGKYLGLYSRVSKLICERYAYLHFVHISTQILLFITLLVAS